MARRMNRFSGASDDSDINLTPMLDVVFIMLISSLLPRPSLSKRALMSSGPTR